MYAMKWVEKVRVNELYYNSPLDFDPGLFCAKYYEKDFIYMNIYYKLKGLKTTAPAKKKRIFSFGQRFFNQQAVSITIWKYAGYMKNKRSLLFFKALTRHI